MPQLAGARWNDINQPHTRKGRFIDIAKRKYPHTALPSQPSAVKELKGLKG